MDTTRLQWHDGQRYTGTDSWGNLVPINGDRDGETGAKPSDLLPISLAACVAYTMVQILQKQRQSWESLDVEIVSRQASEAPWAFEQIDITYTFRGTVDPEKAQKALSLAHEKHCSVAASLSPTVGTSFTAVVEE